MLQHNITPTYATTYYAILYVQYMATNDLIPLFVLSTGGE